MTSLAALALAATFVAGDLGLARAQVGPQPLPQPGQPQGEEEEKKNEGIAEKAPKDPAKLPTTPVLPPPKQRRKKFRFFELDGYFRLRTDWFKDFNLGFDDDPTVGGAPFRESIGCTPVSGDEDRPCSSKIRSANIRLRLEPVINLSESARVFMQIDVLDNVVLGSTPDGTFYDGTPRPTNIPISGFSGGQAPPIAGRNLNRDSITVKRAWAEVMTPLGVLRFGRQPSQWGMGILANAGGANPFDGTYDYDSDYGDSVDRMLFGSIIPGTQFRVAVAYDWAQTSPSADQLNVYANRYDGQPYNLDVNDDVRQWVFVFARLDSPNVFQDRLDRGDLALNYGTYFVYRKQRYDYNPNGLLGGNPDPTAFVPRRAKAFIPDAWLHLGYKKFDFELEAVGIFGEIKDITDVSPSQTDTLDILQFGGAARASYKMIEDRLKLAFEVGFASGDQWDASPQGATNVRDVRTLPGEGDNTVNSFRFDFDYEVDLIFFRELMGTVSNATYLKPSAQFNLTKAIRFQTQGILSIANVPVATPGNGSLYGLELDGDVGYYSDNFFAGVSYGIFFPFDALDHPADNPDAGGPGFGYGADNVGSADIAQTVQTRFVLTF